MGYNSSFPVLNWYFGFCSAKSSRLQIYGTYTWICALHRCHQGKLVKTIYNRQNPFSITAGHSLWNIDSIQSTLKHRDTIHMEYEVTLEELSRKKAEKEEVCCILYFTHRTSRTDWHLISPYIIKTLSIEQVMRVAKFISKRFHVDTVMNSLH